MQVDVRPINVGGRPLPASQRKKEPASRGKLQMVENRNHRLGRVVLCATLIHATDGRDTDLLPELMDAQVIWLNDKSMRVRGVEDVGGTMYAQTWDITVL
jgi:hypothetical protein